MTVGTDTRSTVDISWILHASHRWRVCPKDVRKWKLCWRKFCFLSFSPESVELQHLSESAYLPVDPHGCWKIQWRHAKRYARWKRTRHLRGRYSNARKIRRKRWISLVGPQSVEGVRFRQAALFRPGNLPDPRNNVVNHKQIYQETKATAMAGLVNNIYRKQCMLWCKHKWYARCGAESNNTEDLA